MTRLEQLRSIDHQVLQHFLQTRKSSAIDTKLQEYIIQINSVPSIVHFNGASLTKVVKELCKQFPSLSYSQARGIYEDAMNFFYMDDTVTSDAWDNYYAEQYDKVARFALALNKPEAAIKAFEKAHDLKVRSADRIKPGDWAPPVFIISDKIRPEQLGYEKQNMYDIARKAEDGFYRNLIDGLPVSEKEKVRLKREACVEDVDCEELESD